MCKVFLDENWIILEGRILRILFKIENIVQLTQNNVLNY